MVVTDDPTRSRRRSGACATRGATATARGSGMSARLQLPARRAVGGDRRGPARTHRGAAGGPRRGSSRRTRMRSATRIGCDCPRPAADESVDWFVYVVRLDPDDRPRAADRMISRSGACRLGRTSARSTCSRSTMERLATGRATSRSPSASQRPRWRCRSQRACQPRTCDMSPTRSSTQSHASLPHDSVAESEPAAGQARGSATRILWGRAPHDLPVAAGEVHLWVHAIDDDHADVDLLLPVLGDDERDRARRFHFDRDRRRFVVRRVFARRVLADYLGVQPANVGIVTSSAGKAATRAAVCSQFQRVPFRWAGDPGGDMEDKSAWTSSACVRYPMRSSSQAGCSPRRRPGTSARFPITARRGIPEDLDPQGVIRQGVGMRTVCPVVRGSTYRDADDRDTRATARPRWRASLRVRQPGTEPWVRRRRDTSGRPMPTCVHDYGKAEQ